jgi:hypothetical protein
VPQTPHIEKHFMAGDTIFFAPDRCSAHSRRITNGVGRGPGGGHCLSHRQSHQLAAIARLARSERIQDDDHISGFLQQRANRGRD